MDYRIKEALEIEKKGNYKKALQMYSALESLRLKKEDLIFIKRSIAACYYYLKEYSQA